MKCYEGSIISVDANDGVYKYLIEDKGSILYVGNELPEQFKNVGHINLGNKALVPAFIDTHQHFASLSTFNAGLNVMEAESNEEIAETIGEYAAKTKDKTIIAFGASPHSVKERRLINREEIDAVCLDKKLSKLRGYHPDTGEMNQEAFFACSDYHQVEMMETKRNIQLRRHRGI